MSGIRTGISRVTWRARGSGRPGREPDRHGRPRTDRRCDVRRRRERSPGGPRRHDRQEECLDRPREPLPTRVEGLPGLPTDYDVALEGGLAELGLTLPPASRRAIDDHVRLLLAWTAAINLTAIRAPAEVAVRHVVDSLTAVGPLRARGVTRLVDLGSGGGFPGLPLSVALPSERTLLVESIAKKAGFLEAAAAATGLADRVAVHAGRAERLAARRQDRERWPAVTARAVADLADLIELGFPLLRRGGVLVAWKRGDPGPEIEAARPTVEALGGGDLEVREVPASGLAGHVLVLVTKRAPTPPGFPRDPATRRRRRR